MALDHKRENSRSVRRAADDAQTWNARQITRSVFQQKSFLRCNALHSHAIKIVESGAEANGIGDIARAGFKARRGFLINGPLKGDVRNHVASALPGGETLQKRLLPIEDADARGAEHLVP